MKTYISFHLSSLLEISIEIFFKQLTIVASCFPYEMPLGKKIVYMFFPQSHAFVTFGITSGYIILSHASNV